MRFSLLSEMEILFRAIIEVLGKPQEHVENTMRGYLEKLTHDAKFKLISKNLAEIKKNDNEELWTIFAEVEVKTTHVSHLTYFCLEYMPSVIEIISPQEVQLTDVDLSQFLSDLQARLHGIDMLAKQMRLENQLWRRNIHDLLRNYLLILLNKNNFSSQQLSKLTGVDQDKLEDFLDILIDEGKVDLKEGVYFLQEKKEATIDGTSGKKS